MANTNAQMAEFAENLWNNYIREKHNQENADAVSFYRAKVTAKPGGNFLTIQRPYDNAITVPCTTDMSNIAIGAQALVIRFGNGNNNANHLVVAKGDGDSLYPWLKNTVTQNGYVPAPTSSNKYSVYRTDANGAPEWSQTIPAGSLISTIAGDAETNVKIVPYVSAATLGVANEESKYLEAWLKWICANFEASTNTVFIGRVSPNYNGFAMALIYDTSDVTNGLPKYSTGRYFNLTNGNTQITQVFSTYNYTYSWKALYIPAAVNNSVIGTDSTPVPSGTNTELGTLTLSANSTYIVTFTVSWYPNSNGYRYINVTYGDSSTVIISATNEVGAATSGATVQQVTVHLNASTTNNVLHLHVQQNSGATINATARVAYTRLN